MESKKSLYEPLESMSQVCEGLGSEGTIYLRVKHWNAPEKWKELITEELKEWLWDEEETHIEFLEITEEAYSTQRYCDGQDAKEEGYAYWMNYYDKWKQGRGKCTCYKIKTTRVTK